MITYFATNEEIVAAARRKLSQGAWDYLVGASESETTMRRNRLAFDRIAFRPRVLVDVSHIDAATTFLGHPMRIPVMAAPVGGMHQFDPDGAAAVARAVGEFGTLQTVSSVTQPDLEVTAAASKAPKIFQLYVRGDWEWTKDILSRAKEAGYVGLCLTVDTAVTSRRERPLISIGLPTPQSGTRTTTDQAYQAALSWEQADRIKEFAGLPFMLKGIATAEDAKLAVEHGVDVVWVSNHGGRQLDHGVGTMDTLPEIIEAVGGRADIVLDGGVQRGSDVLKAVAMGVKCVAVGKLQGWGLSANGAAGVVRMLEILETEIVSAMGLLGVTCIDQLNQSYLRPAEPVTPPHEMSAWPNIPGYRIL